MLLSAFFTGIVAAEAENYQPYELDRLIHDIEAPGAPVITDDYIVFTATPNNRYVGIVFDFEEYKIIHPFQVLSTTDDEGKSTRKLMFYCYERQHKFSSLQYRLVIDGLWTIDPNNPNKVYDDNVNLYFSKVEDPGSEKIFTAQTNDSVRFIYKGESGLKLHLAGTFTNWDPWIYELAEVKPGFYELELPLTTGTYYYNYYVGLTPILDSTNPNKAYAPDGRSANIITVN